MADKPQKGVAGDDTGGEARRAIREMLKKGATMESIGVAANRDASTIEQILRGDIFNPPADLAANVRKAKIIQKLSLSLSGIQLAENKSRRVQVAKVGTFQHDVYGQFSIKLSALEQMKSNFDSNVRRQKLDDVPVLPLDYKHDEENIAAGWIKRLGIEKDANGVKGLFAEIEWTPQGAQKVRDREFAFISPSIRPTYQDKETNQKFSNVLVGATLTNIPFLRDMEAVHLLSEGKRKAFESLKLSGDNPDANAIEGKNMKPGEFKKLSPEKQSEFLLACGVTAEDKKLSEELGKSKKDLKKSKDDLKLSEKELGDLKAEMSGSDAAEDRLKLAEGEVTKLKENVSSLTKTLAENAKKAEFDVMLSEGKVCEAQREAFTKNDMATFAKNAQEVKLEESGVNDKGDETADGAEEKAIKLAEAKMKEDKSLDYGAAMKVVLSENSDLKNKLGQ